MPEDSIIFLTFWDFDGIIMKGDCWEGLENEKITEKLIYPVTWGEGKPEKLKNIVNGLEQQNPVLFPAHHSTILPYKTGHYLSAQHHP